MKHGTAIGCIEFNGANTYSVPPVADPNEANLNLEVKVYKLNPDGSKGELIRTDPAYPEGWDLPKFNPNIKEEEKMYPPREDKAEIMATAKKLIEDGSTIISAAKKLNVPPSTLTTWLQKDKKPVSKKQPPPKPSDADIIKIFEQCDGKINAFAKYFDIGWATARAWLRDAGLIGDEHQPEPKKDYFGTPIIEAKVDDKPVQGCPFDEPIFNPDIPVNKPAPVNYGQAVNQLTLSFIFDIYDSDLAPVDKLGLIAKQIKVWEDL